MKNNIWPCYSDKIQKLFFGAVCIILFLPIIILPPTFRPANWSRVIIFKIVLIFLASFLFYRFFYKKNISFSIFNKKNPASLLFLVLSLFFFILILSTIFSADIRFSVFGSPVRSGGIINLLSFFIFALFLSIFIKDEYWTKLLKVNFIVGLIAGLFAIVQYFGLFKKVFVAFSTGGAGPPSFLGNSTFLAIYMLFLTFLAVNFFAQEKNRNKKILYGALSLLFLFTILISGSRATYLGVFTGFIFYFLFYPERLKFLKIATASILALAIIVIALFNLFPKISGDNNLLKTMSSRLSIQRIAVDLTGNRLPAWKMTGQAIKESPLLGWGPENFYIGFEKYYSPVNESLQKEWWDRPHNILLDVFVNYGIFALILYVSFWLLLLIKLQIFKRKESDNGRIYLAHAMQAMFIGYLSVLFFNFDEFPTYLISFFFIGFSIYLISLHGEKREILPSQKSILSKVPVVFFLLILTLLFVWFWNIKPLYLNEKIVWAENLVNQQKCDKGLLAAESIFNNSGILKTYSGLSYVNFIKNCAATNLDKEVKYAQKAMDTLKIISKIQPDYSRTWLSMASFSDVLAAREEDVNKRNEILLEARGYLNKALELSPKRQEILSEFEINYLLAKDYQAMEKTADACIKIGPTQGVCYWYLGIAQIFMGDQVNGKKNIEESKNKNYNDPALLQLGVAYLSQKNYKDAFEVYSQLAKTFHENAGYHAVTAVLAKTLGDYQTAAEETLQVFRIQPQNPESLQFLQELFKIKNNDPVVSKSLASIAYVYKEEGKKEKNTEMLIKAKNIYLQLIKEYPNNYDYHYALADTYFALEEYLKARDEAISVFNLKRETRKNIQYFLNLLPIEPELKILP